MNATTHTVNEPQTAKRGAIVAALIGNFLEFFDFTVFSFFASVIARLYFPTSNPLTSLLLSVATFAAGFIARPLGSILLSTYADRKGRKAALNCSIMLMALGTGMIAVMPTFAQIGVAAPVLIFLARLIQGFAQGGEFGAATAFLLEQGSRKHRGLRSGWQAATQGGAALAGASFAALLSWALPVESFESWGWRVPFLMGLLIAPVGLYLRRHLPDEQEIGEPSIQQGILRVVFSEHRRSLVLVALMVMGGTVSSYVLTFYMPTYAIHTLGLPMSLSMLVGVESGLMALILCPIWGRFSDRTNNYERPLLFSRSMQLVLLFPAFIVMNRLPSLPVVLVAIGVLQLVHSVSAGAQYVLMCEAFPRHVRVTGISIAYTLSVCLFGGTAPMVVTWLIKITGNRLAPAGYVAACLLVSMFAILMLRQSAKKAGNLSAASGGLQPSESGLRE